MKRWHGFKSLKRNVAEVVAIIVIIGGVTFAALQSQQDTLTGNTIETTHGRPTAEYRRQQL